MPSYLYEQLEGMSCPDMGQNKIKLEGMSYFRHGHTSTEYKFVIDTCSNLQDKSGSTCIGDPEIEKKAATHMILIGQEITKFFMPNTEHEKL